MAIFEYINGFYREPFPVSSVARAIAVKQPANVYINATVLLPKHQLF